MNKFRVCATFAGMGVLALLGTGIAGASPPPQNPWPSWLDPIILFIGQLLGLPGYMPGH